MTVHFGDCREVMRAMIERGERVQMCVTSPPYWGLRDYDHPGQLGLEASLPEFVASMVEVFSLVHELLADDGTLWLNMGDSYAYAGGGGIQGKHGERANRGFTASAAQRGGSRRPPTGLKPKDLVGQPWRLAFALQDWGWYLRQDIIWSKPNPMPESVRDRCTKSHEYLFLLAKSERYYFDQVAISEPAGSSWDPDSAKQPDGWDSGAGSHGAFHRNGREPGKSGNKARKPGSARGCPEGTGSNVCGSVPWEGVRRNKRSVWTVATTPYSGAHFATFPQSLIEPCIMAGSRCGDIVLDPFFGSGTTGQVCNNLGRRYVGIELNPDYAPLQHARTAQQGLEL